MVYCSVRLLYNLTSACKSQGVRNNPCSPLAPGRGYCVTALHAGNFATRHYRIFHSAAFADHHRTLLSVHRGRQHVSCSTKAVHDNNDDTRSLAVDAYRQFISQPEEDIRVLKGVVLIANHRYPLVTEADVSAQLDDFAEEVRQRLEGATCLRLVCCAISDYLYNTLGFQPDYDSYYNPDTNPDNSCINKVLEDRHGTDTNLALVYWEVAKRLGVDLMVAGVPGLLMLTPVDELDVFIHMHDGEVCCLADAEMTLWKYSGFYCEYGLEFVRRNCPMSARLYLRRMLDHLQKVYIQCKEPENELTILKYIRATDPKSRKAALQEERLLSAGLYKNRESTQSLEKYLMTMSPTQKSAEWIQCIIRSIERVKAIEKAVEDAQKAHQKAVADAQKAEEDARNALEEFRRSQRD